MYKVNARLSQRIAEESQLLAEEKWIIDALTKLKQQRNSLQIERLHLENLKATIDKENLRSIVTATKEPVVDKDVEAVIPSPAPPISAEQRAPVEEQREPVLATTLAHFDVPVAGIDDDMCNTETLNLSVTDSVFTHQQRAGYDIEEDEDLETGLDDDDDMENCLIDMNMLMHANPC